MRGLAALLAVAITLAAAPGAPAAAGASLADIEDEVMCTICGTTLQLSSSPQAERQRAFINGLIAEGRSKEEIKAALVDEYGPEVLAVPGDDGFDLLGGWILPAVGVLVGAVMVVLAARRWRREQRRADAAAPP
ncbi:MAG: cytochrome c-type biogenesis protein CcmH, partial [Thermoleophilia bacterium]|nr:cytochrome c-type biogenesis protein CcmH [Thermoleophilia bacterium]